MFGEAEQGAAAYTGAADVANLGLVHRDHRGAGPERNHQRALLAGQRGAAHADRGELIDLHHRTPEELLAKSARSSAGRGYAFDVAQGDARVADDFAERAGGGRDRIIRLDGDYADPAIFKDYGVGCRTADIDANDH